MYTAINKQGSWNLNVKDTQYFMSNVIYKWEPQREVWHFRWGGDVSAIMGSFTGIYIMYNLRRELKLRQFARLTCYAPAAGVTLITAHTIFSAFIIPKVLSGRSCPLCVSTQAAALQIGIGVLYPLVISPIIGFYLADKLLTYPIPNLHRAPGEVLRLWGRMLMKNPRPLVAAAFLQGAVMMFITQRQQVFVMDYLGSKYQG